MKLMDVATNTATVALLSEVEALCSRQFPRFVWLLLLYMAVQVSTKRDSTRNPRDHRRMAKKSPPNNDIDEILPGLCLGK